MEVRTSRIARHAEIVTFQESEDSLLRYWRDQSPSARIAAVTTLRRRVFGRPDGPGRGLQRVCFVTRRT